MMSPLRYINLTIVLPDKRLLMMRDTQPDVKTTQWSGTVERYIDVSSDVGLEVNRILYKTFKIKSSFDGGDAPIIRIPPIFSLAGKCIIPFVAYTKTHLNFQAATTEQFYAEKFNSILDDILSNSIYPKCGQFPKHTPTFIHVAKTLHERKELGK